MKMETSTPAISVGMPVYNGEKYMEASIECVLQQTFGDFEFLISDNASTDRTEEICRDYAAQDSRIRYFRNAENIGAAGNYNVLVEKSRARYFRWMNADDLIEKEAHQLCYDVLEARPDAVLAYGKTQLIDNVGAPIELYNDNLDIQDDSPTQRFVRFFEQAGLTNAIYGLMRKDALAQTWLMGNGSLPAADYVVQAQLLLHGKFVEVPKLLFYRRLHEDSSSSDRSDDNQQSTFWSGDNKTSNQFWMPFWRTKLAYMRYGLKAPLSAAEKWKLICAITRQMRYTRHRLIAEIPQLFAR